jgi:hypothetical protein
LSSTWYVEKAKADSVPMAMSVSMLAVRLRARVAAALRNGRPAQNCTGMVRARLA